MKKIPVCPICSGPHYAYSCWRNPKRKSAFKAHFKAVEARQKKKIHKDPSSTENRRKTLIYKLDLVVSRYARQLYADKNGICTCYTCGKRIPWKAGDIGHCISRRYINTRFDLDNLRFQCLTAKSNLEKNGKKVNISEIKAGDIISAFDEQSFEKKDAKVLKVRRFIPKELYRVELENGDYFEATGDHKLVVNGEWKRIDELLHEMSECDIMEA